MANGEFAVNWDGKHERCYQFEVDYAKRAIFFNKDNHMRHVDDWSTFSVKAIAHKEAGDIGYDGGGEPLKVEEVKENAKENTDVDSYGEPVDQCPSS